MGRNSSALEVGWEDDGTGMSQEQQRDIVPLLVKLVSLYRAPITDKDGASGIDVRQYAWIYRRFVLEKMKFT